MYLFCQKIVNTLTDFSTPRPGFYDTPAHRLFTGCDRLGLKGLPSFQRPFQSHAVGVLKVPAHRYPVGYPRYSHLPVLQKLKKVVRGRLPFAAGVGRYDDLVDLF